MSFVFNHFQKNTLNSTVTEKFTKLKKSSFYLPITLLVLIILFLYSQNALTVTKYVQIQKDLFYFLNAQLSQFPVIMYNLTMVGNALIFLSILTPFILFAPKIWEALISALLVTLVLTRILKDFFAIPRPAKIFDNSSFVIVGEKLSGFNSLPSGHSITIFAILTVLLYAFMPKKRGSAILWTFMTIALGLLLLFSRVAVGAHYPLDVIIGGIIGYLSGLIGIFISLKYRIWSWINDKKYYPIFIVLFLVCCIVLINKISIENLFIFYFSIFILLFSIYKIIYVYVKK